MKRRLLSLLAFCLFISTGVAQSITLLKDIVPGSNSGSPQNFIAAHGIIFFVSNGYLWSTDGTSNGTIKIGNMAVGALYSANGQLYIQGVDQNGPGSSLPGNELYKFDASAGNCVLVKDINPTGYGYPQNFIHIGSTLFFIANDGVNGRELWKSDGTTAGTSLMKDINSGAGESYINVMGILNNELYFAAYDPVNGIALWKSNGTTGGTVLVHDFNPSDDSYNTNLIPRNSKVIGNKIYFMGYDAANGAEPWLTDGTSQGTYLIKNTTEGNWYTNPTNFTGANGLVYFTINNNFEFWVTDGTAQGTMRLKQFTNLQSVNSYNDKIYVTNQTLTDPPQNELWTSDGTVAGTVFLSNKAFVNGETINNQFYKIVNKVPSLSGMEIQKSLGSDCKTKTVASVSLPRIGGERITLGNKIIFNGNDPAIGYELYVYDASNDPDFNCQQQTIAFPAIPNQSYGGTYDFAATSSSGLPVSYSIDGSIATLSNNRLTFTGIGTFNVRAHQNGNDLFEPAPSISQQVIVTKSDQTILFSVIPDQRLNSWLQFNATASSGLPVTFAASPPERVNLTGTYADFLQPGKITIVASQLGDAFYNPAESVAQVFCVNPYHPFISSDGTTLSSNGVGKDQWYKDGLAIDGAVGNNYVATESGTYTAKTTVEGCTSEESNALALIVTGLDSDIRDFQVYPNPVNDNLILNHLQEFSIIRILDEVGRVYYTSASNGESRLTVDLKNFTAGLYILEISSSKDRVITKFVKK